MKKIRIQLESDLLCATGESTAFTDGNPVFDKYGLPYIKGKSFKGLLKEAAIEVTEISGEWQHLIAPLFGNDTTNGEIIIRSIRLPLYQEMVNELQSFKLTKTDCLEFFTVTRRQIAMQDGVTRKKSFRTYHLIKKDPEIYFETELCYPPEYEDLMEKTLLQLRYMGTRRNRGFGKVRIVNNGITAPDPLIHKLVLDLPSEKTKTLRYWVKVLSPLHISRPVGDQNTESTEDFIPGSAIRGLVANYIINSNQLSKKAHQDPLFKQMILGQVVYSNANLCIIDQVSSPMPFAVGYDKTAVETDRKPINIFDTDKGGIKNYRRWTINHLQPEKNEAVKLTQHFHHRREKNRLAGRSTDTDQEGAIFYYESIEEDQIFSGTITGPVECIELFRQILAKPGHRIGGSKSAQYGNVEFSSFDSDSDTIQMSIENGKMYYLVCQSHCLLYNEYGFPEPTPDVLNEHLQKLGLKLTKIKENEPARYSIASRIVKVEQFYSPWKSHSGLEHAYALGSTCRVTATETRVLSDATDRIGERINEGFGQFRLLESLTATFSHENNITLNTVVSSRDPNDLPVKNKIVQGIMDLKIQKRKNAELSLKAIEFAEGLAAKNTFRNHQISRLKHALSRVKLTTASISDWEKAITKKLPNSLEELLLNDLVNCKSNKDYDSEEFGYYQTYWMEFLNYLRRKAKKDN